MNEKLKESAFPVEILNRQTGQLAGQDLGMSIATYAAIHLKQPISEHEEINDAIRKAKREDFAVQAMNGMSLEHTMFSGRLAADNASLLAKYSYLVADAMIKQNTTNENDKPVDGGSTYSTLND